jgi:GDP/UDP-N,N'-diacetylbacillosamine 2-epimerase (hydrolysing)
MGGYSMRIGVLTSSRADYGVYLPLLMKLKDDPFFDLGLLVFGTHLSEKYGMTIGQIENDGFKVQIRIETMSDGDLPSDISISMAKTISGFAKVWRKKKFDLVFALGDRYEMFAAVASSIPFNIPMAHLHGGETTLGAIDNVFRHSITLMSSIHFPSTDPYKNRIIEITGRDENIYNVGALSIDNLITLKLYDIEEFYNKFSIDLSKPTILITFHPETISYEKNEIYINELIHTLEKIQGYQLVFTMPNADTMGEMIREYINKFINSTDHAIGVENFGTLGYLSCMKHCSFMLGNTSSGFVEASYFGKPVINLGNRQKGRILTPNIFSIPIDSASILDTINKIEQNEDFGNCQIYGDGKAAEKIVMIVKRLYELK